MKVQEEINGMGWWSDIEEEEKEQAQTNRIRRARERDLCAIGVSVFVLGSVYYDHHSRLSDSFEMASDDARTTRNIQQKRKKKKHSSSSLYWLATCDTSVIISIRAG